MHNLRKKLPFCPVQKLTTALAHALIALTELTLLGESLGVQIDESLNWRPHIHTISKKISAGIAILRRVSHFIPFDTRVNMYNALVMPYFNYCGAVWGNINKGLADKLQKLQNRAARILTFSNYDVRSSVL